MVQRVAATLRERPSVFPDRFPRFAQEWEKHEFIELIRGCHSGASIKECARAMGRTPYEIDVVANRLRLRSSTAFARSLPNVSIPNEVKLLLAAAC
jgi:hypothetical protein